MCQPTSLFSSLSFLSLASHFTNKTSRFRHLSAIKHFLDTFWQFIQLPPVIFDLNRPYKLVNTRRLRNISRHIFDWFRVSQRKWLKEGFGPSEWLTNHCAPTCFSMETLKSSRYRTFLFITLNKCHSHLLNFSYHTWTWVYIPQISCISYQIIYFVVVTDL